MAEPKKGGGSTGISGLVFAIAAPIVGYPPWHQDITDEMKGRVKIERMKALMLNENLDMATDYEAMVYLHTASLAAPMNSRWCRIYLYLFKKFYPKKADFISEADATVSKYELRYLNDLKRWIYRKQKEAMKNSKR